MLVVTEAMNSESANKFISALVKALQTLCHGYVEFNDGIEIIGHIYLNIDSGSSFDYVVKEKLCKNAENSTVFVSKSFQALAPADDCLPRKDRDDDHSAFEDASMSPTSGTSRLQSAITSISNVLSGVHENIKPRIMEHSSHHHSALQHTGKRKKEHNGNYSSMQPPLKYTTLQTSSSSSSSSVYFGSGHSSKQAADRNHAEHFSNASHTEFFGADSNQGPEDEDDLHLDVTFVKEEYESQRNSVQRGVSVSAASRLSQDLSSNSSSMLHDGNSGSGTLGYASSHHQLPQQFASGTAGNMGSLNPAFQDTSQGDMDQHGGPKPPNPRNDASAGPPVRMPEGVKPLCGYVHPDDAKKWMMFELVPGSGVYIHQENYSVVLSKTRQDRPDGKAMARYLMSCFWRQSELVGASIAEPPKPHQRSLDRGIIHSILGFCQHHSRELPTDIRRAMQQKIGYAKFYFVKKNQDPDTPKMTPASISLEASPRRMSMEMARRGAGGIPLNLPSKVPGSRNRARTTSETSTSDLSESDEMSQLSARGNAHLLGRHYSDIGSNISHRLSDDSEMLVDSSRHLSSDVARRMSVDLSNRISSHFTSHIPGDLPERLSRNASCQLPDDLSVRSASNLSPRSSEISVSRMSSEQVPEATMGVIPGRAAEISLQELASRLGSEPAGMSRGFMDMLNNIDSSS